jgi:hypothetical protein
MHKFRSLVILASIAVPLAATPSAFADASCSSVAGNLIQNCSFETGSFTGWTVTDPSNFTGVDGHNPSSGNYAANLGATGTGVVSQSFTDVVGDYYGFSFSLENEVALGPDGSPYQGTNSFSASFENDLGNTYILTHASNIAESPTYSDYEVFFFGTGVDTIIFTYNNGPSYFDLDNVSVVDPPAPGPDDYPSGIAATPEPSGLVLLGTGILSVAGLTRRRFQRASATPAV